jgi:hypothetical protein
MVRIWNRSSLGTSRPPGFEMPHDTPLSRDRML